MSSPISLNFRVEYAIHVRPQTDYEAMRKLFIQRATTGKGRFNRQACSPDTAACEGFFGRLKNELFYPRDWKNVTNEQFIKAVNWYFR